MAWRGSAKVKARKITGKELEATLPVIPIANKRCRAIVRQHVAGDSPLSRIAEDCYLQGVRDTVDSMRKTEVGGGEVLGR